MSDPRLEAIRERHKSWHERDPDPHWSDVAYLLALIDTLQRELKQHDIGEFLDELRAIGTILKAKPEQTVIDAATEVMLALDLAETLRADLHVQCDTLQRERDELRSELDAIAALVSDRDEAGTYAKVEGLEAQVSRLTEALEIIASRAAGCQLESHDANSDEPVPEFVAVNEIYEWARKALASPNQEPQPE